MRLALEFFFATGLLFRPSSPCRFHSPSSPGPAWRGREEASHLLQGRHLRPPSPPWGPRPTSILPLPRSRFPSGWLFFSRPWRSVLPGERDPPPSAQDPRAHETHRSIASRHHGGSCCTSQTPAEQVRDRLLQTGAGSDHGHGHVRNLPRRKNQSGRQSRCVLRHTPPSSKKKART